MKRLAFLLVALIVATFSAFSQTDEFLSRTSSSSIIRTGLSDKHPLHVCVLAMSHDAGKTWKYSLQLLVSETTSRAMPKDALLLIRTRSGQTIELRNTLEELRSRDFIGETIQGSSVIMYKNKGSYDVTMEQLLAISGGVEKVRIAFLGAHVDSEYKKDRWGDPVKKMIEEINLQTAAFDIREGF